MSLNFTSTIFALSSMNFTLDCSTSLAWLEQQGSQALVPIAALNNSINVAFLRAILPAKFDTISDQSLFGLYDQLATAKPSFWYDPAVEAVQVGCSAPQLAKTLPFGSLDLTQNCFAAAASYSNSLCAVNGPQSFTDGDQSGWTVDRLGNSQWIVGGPSATPPNATSTLIMLRSALPSQYQNVSDVELGAWASLIIEQPNNFTNKSQIAHLCDVCLADFCAAADFTGNPDIAGIGVSKFLIIQDKY